MDQKWIATHELVWGGMGSVVRACKIMALPDDYGGRILYTKGEWECESSTDFWLEPDGETIRFQGRQISAELRELKPSKPTLYCGHCAAHGVVTVTRAAREWRDPSGVWRPICRACYRELRAAYACGSQGPDEIRDRGTMAQRMAALREVTR